MRTLHAHLYKVENELSLLLNELSYLTNLGTGSEDKQPTTSSQDQWNANLDGFRVRAMTIRRILSRFQSADISTRRYLRQHLDEEFSSLKNSYESLREQFATEEDMADIESKAGGS